jgi:ubiquinone/menaquinone biosynthesis C-methylase UbiE
LGRWLLADRLTNGVFIGIDPLPERVKIADEKNTSSNATYKIARAEDLGFIQDSSIDFVYLSAVYHWIADKPKALKEIRRVLKVGGKVGLTTGAKELAEKQTNRRILKKVLTSEKYADRIDLANIFPSNRVTATQLVEQFIEANLALSSLEIIRNDRIQPNGAFIADHMESSTFGNYLNNVPADLRSDVRKDFVAELDKTATQEGIKVTGFTILAIAEKSNQCKCGLKKENNA